MHFVAIRSGLGALSELVIPIGFDQSFQLDDHRSEAPAALAIGHPPRRSVPRTTVMQDDIRPANNGRLDGLEMMMPRQDCSMRLQDQRESVIAETFRKGTVNGNGFSACLKAIRPFPLPLECPFTIKPDRVRRRIGRIFRKPGLMDQTK
jgi:hypothetical protein